MFSNDVFDRCTFGLLAVYIVCKTSFMILTAKNGRYKNLGGSCAMTESVFS